MYLKSLELVGFKSFAEKTRLEFDRGITAIVGPNGCGKSNIADAIRWVLGEQSARALRGTKMEDCIFNGTETHKPLGMAEVSITLADCEKALGTEFHEVTITRRILRTGEGQYFINKTPCRLKDIQRLFMDTGMGTDSYAVMEQGKIDMILSARPEDRRAVFEVASGITKYKADKKEALRKLEHTEANLVRLADIIREVRRQIISLQRQAGKARRYKALQERLRSLDIYATRERLAALDAEIQRLEFRQATMREREETLRVDVENMERQAAESRHSLAALDNEISAGMEHVVRLQTDLERARELIRINQDRIRELTELSERDTKDLEEAEQRLQQHRAQLEALRAEYQDAVQSRDRAEQALNEATQRLADKDKEIEGVRKRLHDLGTEAVDLESRTAKWQNELTHLDSEERSAVIRRERLAAEEAELQRAASLLLERQARMAKDLQALRVNEQAAKARLDAALTAQAENRRLRAETARQLAELDARLAALQAQVELLHESEGIDSGFPGGARAILSRDTKWDLDRSQLLGPLAEHLRARPPYELALEAALRSWLDALVVSRPAVALEWIEKTHRLGAGAIRLLAAATDEVDDDTPITGPGQPLLDFVDCSESVRPLVRRLLRHVRVVASLNEIPAQRRSHAVYVTTDGQVVRGLDGFELWAREIRDANPFTRRHQRSELAAQIERLQRERDECVALLKKRDADEAELDSQIVQYRTDLDEQRHRLGIQEGEKRVIDEEVRQAQERADTVAWELKVLTDQHGSGTEHREQIRKNIEEAQRRHAEIRSSLAAANEQIRFLERERMELASLVADARVQFAERRQQVEHLESRKAPLEARIRELEELMQNRSAGVHEYKARAEELAASIREAEARLAPLGTAMAEEQSKLEALRKKRAEVVDVTGGFDSVLREKRAALETARRERSSLDVELAEQRVRRQNIVERISAEYRITPDQMAAEPTPVWEDGQVPDRDTLETMIAEIRAKLDAMGPVNLVAIEEHQEHEQRYAFLTQQQQDLLNAKQQLMDLIRKINKTTTELFSQTFQQVNANFQEMFRKLFGGGTARLVLVNEEDILESGIEIIARPPGKKLQNVSLLSGGERTLTAVALLFALYMVKPSPFCLLDELDAALDEANIGRFTSVLKEFVQHSQFIVITHSRQTLHAAEALYGVTMEEKGVSKIVSVKFSHHEKQTDRAVPQTQAAETSTPEPSAT